MPVLQNYWNGPYSASRLSCSCSFGKPSETAKDEGRGDTTTIQDERERNFTRDRISYLLDLLARLRVSIRPEESALVLGGYRTEVERMQRGVLDYLTQPAAPPTAKASQPGRKRCTLD